MAKSREYKGYIFEDNGHGDLYNAEVDKFLIFRPYPMMVETIIHKDDSVTMNRKKFKENTDKNKGVYEEGYEENDDGSVYVEANDVDESIYQESKDNKSTASEDEISDDYKVGNLAQQEKWNSYFTLESQLGDMEAAQEYLDADDMTQYIKDEPYGHKIDSIKWVLDDDQSGHVEILTNEHLTEEEAEELQDWIDGQNSDGLGEGFEQQDFANAYYNPDTGDGPYTYQEAEQEIADIIDSADISDVIDYVDESEIEAAVDTYMEDNDLYSEYISEHQDEAYDDILEFVDPSEVERAYSEVKGEEITEDEMDNLYDIIRSDDSLKEEVGNNLLQNLASYEMADFVAGMEGGDDFREQCKEDMLNDDPEGYISDDAIYEARTNYANDHYNTNIDEWGSMASMRRSVDGLQLETPAIEEDEHIMTREEYEKTWEGRENSRDLYSATSYEDYLNSLVDSGEISPMQREQYLNDDGLDEGEFKVSPGVMMDMVANGAKVKHDELYTTLAAADFVSDKLSDEFGANWKDVHEEDLREAITHFTNEYNDANVQPEYKNEDFYGDEANPDKVYDELMDRINVENSGDKVNSNLKADDISTIALAFNDINDKHGYAIDKAAEILNQEGLRDVYHITAGNVGSNKAEIEFEDGSKITFGEDGATISGTNLNSYDMQIYQRAAKAYENNLNNKHSFDFGNNAWHLNPDDYDEPKEFIDKINEHNDRALASKNLTAQQASQNQINRLDQYEDAYDAYDKAMEKANTMTYDEYRKDIAKERYEKGYNANELSYQDLKDIQDYADNKTNYEKDIQDYYNLKKNNASFNEQQDKLQELMDKHNKKAFEINGEANKLAVADAKAKGELTKDDEQMLRSIYTYSNETANVKEDKYYKDLVDKYGQDLVDKKYKEYENKYDIVPNTMTDSEGVSYNSLKERVNNDYSKTLDATRKEIQSYFDTPLDERLNEFGDKDDFYKYINDNYYNVGKNDFDRIYNEELQNRVSNDVVNSFNKIDNFNRTSRNQDLYDKIKVDKSNDVIKILQGTSNGSIDLEDNYEIRKYDDGNIQISSSHPYDLSDYSFAKYADYNTSFSVYSPKGELVTVVNSVDDAINEMKKIDKKIKARIDRT